MKKPETVEVKLAYRHSNGFTRNCFRTLLVFSTRDWCAQCPDCGGYLFITPFGTRAASPGTPSIADITWIDDYGDEVQGMSEAIEKLRNWRPNQPPLKWCDLKKAVEEYDKLIEDYERIEWKYNEILEVFINEIHQIREMLAPAVTPE